MRMPELALPPPSAPPLLSEGLALGVWRLRKPLHASDGSQWYGAQHALAADRASAVLVLHRSERAAGVMLRFADQAGDLGRLNHPAIVVPSDSGITPAGHPYLILNWVEGRPLPVACAGMPLRERLQLTVQLCEILRYVHQQGWLLGEVDPAMLWVGADQSLKLMGLGLTRMPDPADPFERGLSLGVMPVYQAPELRAGELPSLASEVYSLGVLLCGLVDGRLPVDPGDGFEDASPATAWPGLSTAERLSLDALLRRAVSPSLRKRHPSAEALADDLRAWLSGENHAALAAAADSAPAPLAAESELSARSPAPQRGWQLALISLAMASLAVAGWAAHRVLSDPPSPDSAATAPAKR